MDVSLVLFVAEYLEATDIIFILLKSFRGSQAGAGL